MTSQDLRIIAQRVLTIGLLLAVFSASMGVVMYFALRGRAVEVPNVIGKTEAEAADVLEDLGLRMKVQARANPEKSTAQVVNEQEPVPGRTVKTGQLVRVSLGPTSSEARSR